MKSLKNKTVVITGAASGIGEALARDLAQRGARLVLADVDVARLEALQQSLSAQGARCAVQVCDVSRAEEVEDLARLSIKAFGGADVLINNAGVALVAPATSMTLEDAHWLMDINFWGVVHGCRAFAPQLQSRSGSVIVNLSSIFAMVSLPTQSLYNASKAAVRAFSDALREELKAPDATSGRHSVQVLCVHPGGIRTRIVEQARLGDIQAMASSPDLLRAQFNQAARTSAEDAASAIVKAVLAGRSRLLIGSDARLLDLLYRWGPARASARFHRLTRWGRQRLQAPREEPHD